MTTSITFGSNETQVSRLEVVSIRREATGVVGLSLRSPGSLPLPNWTPGAHIEVHLPGGLIRHYSLCGDPADEKTWRIAVLREPTGRGGSEFIHDSIRQGDVVTVKGPRNNFKLVESSRYLFIAGGIGITPIIPMIRQISDHGIPWTLLYGGRSSQSMAFIDDVRSVRGGAVHIWPEDQHGLLDLARFLSEPRDDTAVYCCGPGPLLDAVEQYCAAWPPGALHLERFAPKTPVATLRSDGEFEVRLARSGESLHVPPSKSLLEVLEGAGYDIDNSCRAGICGTCEVAVCEGVPDHLDDVLSDEERDSNQVILACVSRSRTPVLVLDL